MHSTRVRVRDLTEERLDANYYDPLYLANSVSLAACGFPLSSIGSIAQRCNCGATPKLVEYASHGTGLIRTADVRPNQFGTDSVLRISGFKLKPGASVEARPGDMVYTMSGTIGYAAVIPFDAENYSFSNTIARVRLPANSPNDVHYLSTFFNSHRGYLQSLRLVSGGIQGHVMPNPFKKLRVPSPLPKAQKYIGEKVRQAERLWERSRLCELDIHSALNSIVPPYSTTPQKWSRVSAQILGERFDNQPYRTHFLSLLNSVRSIRHEPLSRLATVTGGDPVPSELFGNSGVPLVRIRDISNAGFSNPEVRLPESYALKRVEALATEGMIVVGMDGEFRAQFFLREELPQLVNQRVAIVKAHGIRPELLAIWLSRTEGQYQLNRWTTQTTVGHIGLDDIRLVLVPRLEEAIENALADKALIARRCVWYAHTLITAAKLLVEALIEGKVTETELVNAHDALELSDITADRPLLRRLTHQGLDVPGQPPLFPELDALYALLAQTREEIQ